MKACIKVLTVFLVVFLLAACKSGYVKDGESGAKSAQEEGSNY